jgi:asparagine synthetase B (glutamine-hydrolysing)
MMSGGLDSTAVAATAARLLKLQGKRLAAVTEVPRAGF